MRRLAAALTLLLLTSCATLPLESQWLDQLQREAGERGDVVVATAALATLRLPAWTVGERAIQCMIPKGTAREEYAAALRDQIFHWHLRQLDEAGLSVLVDAVSVAHPESMNAWVELLGAVVEAEITAAERYEQFECGRK